MTDHADVTFYRQDEIRQDSANSLASVVPHGTVVTDFCVGPSGTFYATTSDGCLLTAHRVNSLLEWRAHKTFMHSCHRLAVRPGMVYVMGRSYSNGKDVSRTLPPGDPQKWKSRIFLGTYKMGKGAGRKRDTVFPLGKVAGQEACLIEQRPIPSMIQTENATVTTMDLPEDDHYVVCGTDRGNIEVFRMAKSKSLYVRNFAPDGSNIPIQKVFCVPNGNTIRIVLVYADFMTSYSISNPTLQEAGYIAAYAFNAYGENLQYMSQACMAQPAFGSTICPVRLPKCPYAIAYFNPKSDFNTVEYLQPQIPALSSVDLGEFDTIFRNQHLLTSRMGRRVMCNLQPDITSSAAAGVSGASSSASQMDGSGPTLLAIYDGGDLVIFNSKRFLYRAENFTSTYLTSLNQQTGSFVLLSTNPARMELYEFSLLDVDMRIDALLEVKMYDEALALAKVKEDQDKIALVRCRHAESLFSQGNFKEACKQYCLTIGFLEPSLVTKRFLDKERYQELVEYLEALHYAGKASAPHTSFLVSMYARTRNEPALNKFVDQIEQNRLELLGGQAEGRDGEASVPGGSRVQRGTRGAEAFKADGKSFVALDIPSAVNTCYQYGFLETAIRIAACLGSESLAFSLLVAERRFQESLALLQVLPAADCKACLISFGQPLLEAKPRETTDIMISLCSSYVRLPYSSLAGLERTVADSAGKPAGGPLLWAQALSRREDITRRAPETQSADDLLVLYTSEKLETEEIRLLDAVFERRPAGALSRSLIHLYSELLLKKLFLVRQSGSDGADATQRKVEAFLDRICGNPQYSFDPDYVLTRCQIYRFEEGVLKLYRHKQAWVEMIRHYLARSDLRNALEVHRQMIDAIRAKPEPDQADIVSLSIWNELLATAVRSGDTEAAQRILDLLKDDPAISSASVLEMVVSASQGAGSGNGSEGATLGLVYPFLRARFEKASSSLLESTQRLTTSRAARERLDREAASLQKPVVYTKGTCKVCGMRVDPPFIYMRCGHAFHTNCLMSSERVCPECYPNGLGAGPQAAGKAEEAGARGGAGLPPTTLGELAQALAEGRGVV